MFSRYFKSAASSVEITCSKRKKEIEKVFSAKNQDSAQKMINAECKRIKEKARNFQKELSRNRREPHTIYVPESVPREIELYAEGSEKFYYSTHKTSDGRYMKYFNAVIEEYTRLAYCQREAVFFADRIELINSAIRQNCAILFYMGTQKSAATPLPLN